MSARDYVGMAKQYARDVVSGKILACQYVRQSCERFLAGVKAQKAKAYPYRLDEEQASRVCRFVELLPHVKGKWARNHERIKLEPWQAFVIVNVFGWIVKATGHRRYRRVYIEVPRKNAKSTLTAAIANYMLTADGEHGAEVYSGATTEKQAWEVFGPARLMAKQTPEMVEHFGVTVGAKNLAVLGTASKFEPIIGKPGDGASPSFSVTDEYHEHATSEQFDTMVTGMGAREQPIAWAITTAGSNVAGPCYALRQQAVDMLSGAVEHPELWAIVYTIDEDTDWTSEDALRMANPNMGVSVFADFLRTEQRRALADPREQSTFKTKHLNVWVTAASPFFNAEGWKQCGDAPPEVEFAGSPCVLAFDLASKIDVTAKAKVYERDIDGRKHYYAYTRLYVPGDRAKRPEFRHYAAWAQAGHLVTTPGSSTDHDYIEADIKADCESNTVLQIGGDQWNAGQLITHLQSTVGADRVVAVPQTVTHLSEPMKFIQSLIEDRRIHHDGNPVMAWMMGNVTAQRDRNDNVFPRKEAEERKIDGAVALIIAMGRRAAFERGKSVYATRGIDFITIP